MRTRVVVLPAVLVLWTVTAFASEGRIRRVAEPVTGKYIVAFEDRVGHNAAWRAEILTRMYGGTTLSVYDAVLSGFSIEIPEQAAQQLSHDPWIRYIEEASEIHLSTNSEDTSQDAGLWDLDRIDQQQIDPGGLDGSYAWCPNSQVRAYVIDTGVRADHSEFSSGQVEPGVDFSGGNGTASNPCSSNHEANGSHGTWVASVLAGHTYGAAKDTTIVPVRILDCHVDSSNLSTRFLDGLNWIMTNGQLPAVVNMSFWLSESTSISDALSDLEAAGFVLFASANNFPNDSACSRAPAKYARSVGGPVITVGGTMIGARGDGAELGNWVDYRWQEYIGGEKDLRQDKGSSWGPCVDLWAPARKIKIADYTTPSSYRVLSGTSFSSPLAAGVAARWLRVNPGATPDDVWIWMRGNATENLVMDVLSTPHGRILYFRDSCRSRPVRR